MISDALLSNKNMFVDLVKFSRPDFFGSWSTGGETEPFCRQVKSDSFIMKMVQLDHRWVGYTPEIFNIFAPEKWMGKEDEAILLGASLFLGASC